MAQLILKNWDFPGSSVVKNLPTNAKDVGDVGSIPGWGRSPGEGNGTPLQYSCLGNPMDRGAWWATVHGGHKELDMMSNRAHQVTRHISGRTELWAYFLVTDLSLSNYHS